MQKIFLSLIALACAITLFYIALSGGGSRFDAAESLAVSGQPVEVLFEHRANQETFLLYRTAGGGELSLAYIVQSLVGSEIQASATQYEPRPDFSYVVLPQSPDIPYTVYAGITDNADLAEVFVTEPGFPIAHGIQLLESNIPGIYVWMAISADFVGTHYSIVAVDASGHILSEAER